MAFITPYVTDKFTAYLGDILTSRLSLAVRLMDDYTKKEAIGNIRVRLKELDVKPVQNLSGYYFFTDLTPGRYNVAVEPDIYFQEEKPVDTSILDPKSPVIEIILKPKPAYPFSGNAAFVRGVVSDGNPVTYADIKVSGKTNETKTDERGEFVLFFRGIKTELITIEIKKGGDTKTINATIEEGKTVSAGVIPFP